MSLKLLVILGVLVCPYLLFNTSQVSKDGDTGRSAGAMIVLFGLVVIVIGLIQ